MASNVEWLMQDGKLCAYVDGTEVTWFPQPGSQEAFLRCPIYETLLAGNRGGGKSLSNLSRILTNKGWKLVGDITYEDKLVAPDGTYTKIEGIFPQKDDRPLHQLTFCDGASVVADAEHRWEVYNSKTGYSRGWQVRTTKQLLDSRESWSIPAISAPVPGKQWTGPDPYMLGLLLGDGTLTGSRTVLYTSDEPIQVYAESKGFSFNSYKPNVWQGSYTPEDYRNILGHVSKEAKYIPEELLLADPGTRLALLQGMMDADGSCDKEGRISACSISEELADGYVYLVRSLGGFAQKHYSAPRSLQNKTKRLPGAVSELSKPIWRINISHRNVLRPFTLKRKLDRIRPTRRYRHRAIKLIAPCGTGPATCFKVAHPSHLFVVQDFIVTHNTDTLLMDFAQEVGKGFGQEWRGVLFRRTYPELDDVVNKSQKWFSQIWPMDGPNPATFNVQKMSWTWKTGEVLLLRHMSKESDYLSYHGHAFPWIGWEELTTWADDSCYKRMFSCCRSSHPVVAQRKRIRSTTNPYGPGKNWVKKRFRLPIAGGKVIGPIIRDSKNSAGDVEPARVAIRSSLVENKILLLADPTYLQNLRASARNVAELAAWIEGSWDITCGGMFDDIWDTKIHVIEDIPYSLLKKAEWKLNRAYDHGQAKPFSVGWWAQSNGEGIEFNDRIYGPVKGDLILFDEWYGYTGEDNEGINMPSSLIAEGLKEREATMKLTGRIKRGPADSQIFAKHDGGTSPASEMRKKGVYWDAVDKSAGSRAQGWERIREYLIGAKGDAEGFREVPGIFVCERCVESRRTVPCLPRSDTNLDDVNTKVEDHAGDMWRYRVRWTRKTVSRRKW